jgi:outer membrane biosynthesis protein TonB
MADMRGGFAFSVAVHAALLALLIFGLPYLHPKPRDMPPMISVELVDMGKETTTNKISDANKVKEKLEEEKPAPPTPPPPESKPTPEPDPQPVEAVKPQPELKVAEAPTVPQMDTVAELKMPEKVETKPPPPPKVEPKKEPQKPAAPDFDSVLKNLTKDVKEPNKQPVPAAKAPPVVATGAQAPISSKLTQSETDRLMQQLARCWTAPSAVKDAQNLIVVLEVTVNPDRTSAQIQVEDQGRMGDPAFSAAANAAKRALRMPECQYLDLPPEKYQEWQDLEITFDPSKMLG